MSWSGPKDFLKRLQKRLHHPYEEVDIPVGGDEAFWDETEEGLLRDAGVLFGIVDRGDNDLHLVLTERPKTMSTHAGQIALPGGKVDLVDNSPLEAALREAKEEVGVVPDTVEIIGRADTYITGSGFRITPVIGLLPPDFEAVPDPYEVDDVFETPLSFLMNPDNHVERSAVWKGKKRSYFEMPHNGRYIWGVTAGMIRALYKRLYSEDSDKT